MTASAPILYKLNQVRKDYLIGSVTVSALRGVSLSIHQGEFIALKGPSGSGKSTLLNILGLIENPTFGDIFFESTSVATAGEAHLTKIRREAIGFIFQNFNLIPVLSAVENVAYSLALEADQ